MVTHSTNIISTDIIYILNVNEIVKEAEHSILFHDNLYMYSIYIWTKTLALEEEINFNKRG